jgi:hypothetical protein
MPGRRLGVSQDWSASVLNAAANACGGLGTSATNKVDCDQVSKTHFPKGYIFPEGMRFACSDALFPPAELAPVLGAEYECQCMLLCFRPSPSWADVQAPFVDLRELL